MGNAQLNVAIYLEQNIIETPRFCTKHTWQTFLAFLDEEGEVNSTRACVTSCPGLARAGIGCMTVSAEGLAVDKGLRYCVNSL